VARGLGQDRQDLELEGVIRQHVGGWHADEGSNHRHEMAGRLWNDKDQAFRDGLNHPSPLVRRVPVSLLITPESHFELDI